MEEVKEGVKVGGRLTKALRFADDQAMLAGSQKGLQKMMDRLNKISKEYDMKINIKKTKIMRISKGKETTVKITIDGKELEQVGKFCYLGSMITNDAKCHVEIKRRIAMGKDAFYKRKELMRGKLNKNLKKRIIKSMIWSVVRGVQKNEKSQKTPILKFFPLFYSSIVYKYFLQNFKMLS